MANNAQALLLYDQMMHGGGAFNVLDELDNPAAPIMLPQQPAEPFNVAGSDQNASMTPNESLLSRLGYFANQNGVNLGDNAGHPNALAAAIRKAHAPQQSSAQYDPMIGWPMGSQGH